MSAVDYREYYHLERYLFDEVSRRFAEERKLGAFDFFCIIIWKANRVKRLIAKLLLAKGFKSLDAAVSVLTESIAEAKDDRSRLQVLMNDWGFRLPMASAILTVLYPQSFTVYDRRVCESLNRFHRLKNRTKIDSVWDEYQEYILAVAAAVNKDISLRDKDRWLWGKSFCDQLQNDISSRFST